MKRPKAPKKNASPSELKAYSATLGKFTDQESRRRLIRGRMAGWLALFFVIAASTAIYFFFDRHNGDSEGLIAANDKVRALQKEVSDVEKAKAAAFEDVKVALVEKAKAEEAAKKADAAKVEAELASRAANMQLDEAKKSVTAEVSKQLADAKQKFDNDLALAKEATSKANQATDELKKKLDEKDKELAAAKAAPAPAPIVVNNPPVTVFQETAPNGSVIQLKRLVSAEPPTQGKHVGASDATMYDFLMDQAAKSERESKANPKQASVLFEYADAFKALAGNKVLSARQKQLIQRVITIKLSADSTPEDKIDGKQLKLALEQTRNS